MTDMLLDNHERKGTIMATIATARLTVQQAQQLAALQLANEVRSANARTLEWLRSAPTKGEGLKRAAELIRSGSVDGPFGALDVRRLVLATRGVGTECGERLLQAAGVFRNRRIRSMTSRQRELLATAMDDLRAGYLRNWSAHPSRRGAS